MDEPQKQWQFLPEWWRWLIAIALMAAFSLWIVPGIESTTAVAVASFAFFTFLSFVVLPMKFPPSPPGEWPGMKPRFQFAIITLLVFSTIAAISFVVFSFVGETAAWMVLCGTVGAYSIWSLVRWVNRRDDQKSASRRPDAP